MAGVGKDRTQTAAFKLKAALGSANRLDRNRAGLADASKIIATLDRMKDILDARLEERRKELAR